MAGLLSFYSSNSFRTSFESSDARLLSRSSKTETPVAVQALIYSHRFECVTPNIESQRGGHALAIEIIEVNDDLIVAILPSPFVNNAPLAFQSPD